MKAISVTLPERMRAEVNNYIQNGWFTNEAEVLRTALQEFIMHNRLKLAEQFMKEDIEWAIKVKDGLGDKK
ncbi:MAG: ribbon-helix-helix domain-containing protein [Proteobacteria bacterium]|nr:ribbon-helix-helix domain-containing protein [Pseudomonadota bacterium]